MSAARGRHCSTGCSRAVTAERSFSESKTPTRNGRPRKWLPAFSSRCTGWDSSGMKDRRVGGPHAPYFQTQRFDRHREVAHKLLAGGSRVQMLLLSRAAEAEARRSRESGRGLEIRSPVPAAFRRSDSSARDVRRCAGDPFQDPAREDVVHRSRSRRYRVRSRAKSRTSSSSARTACRLITCRWLPTMSTCASRM